MTHNSATIITANYCSEAEGQVIEICETNGPQLKATYYFISSHKQPAGLLEWDGVVNNSSP